MGRPATSARAGLPGGRATFDADLVGQDWRAQVLKDIQDHVHVYIYHLGAWRSFSLFDAEKTVFGLKNLLGWSVMNWNWWRPSDICLFDEQGREVHCAIDDAVPLRVGENFYMEVDDRGHTPAESRPEVSCRQRSRSRRPGGDEAATGTAISPKRSAPERPDSSETSLPF